MKIVYMGTPAFAVPPLEALIEAGHEICAVYTMPDKPKGRGYTLTASAVKECALLHNLPVFQPMTMRDGQAAAEIREMKPDVIVVVAYGKILPKEILDLPLYGCINVHASILPKYRGASPIQWAIVCGETETGITTMLLNEGMDTGDILKTATTEIPPIETAEELLPRLCELGASLLIKTLDDIATIVPEKQEDEKASYAPIIKKEDGLISWGDSAKTINNKIRGLQPWPIAFTKIQGKILKIYRANILGETDKSAGEIVESKNSLVVACGDGVLLEITELMLEGSKRMKAADMLRGKPIETGTILG